MRKSQMEIIGFMVIVILLVFIGLIFFIFSSTKEYDFSSDVRESIEVNNLIKTIIKYKHCEVALSRSFQDVIRDCYSSGGDYCGTECKLYVKTTIEDILAAYGVSDYSFEIKDETSVFISGGGCSGDVMKGKYYLGPASGQLVFELALCS